MAKRYIYIPHKDNVIGITEREVDFKWFPGLSRSQKQKSISSLHEAARVEGISPILEISTKSESELGVELSAFNLSITTVKNKKVYTVESAFQGSKVFQYGGPYTDLFTKRPSEAKKDTRLKTSGQLSKFMFFNQEFPLQPRTFFYDWLYVNALNKNKSLNNDILNYSGFTDIEFNPEKSINCQAYSAALYVSLTYSELLDEALLSAKHFAKVVSNVYNIRSDTIQMQSTLKID